MTSLAYRCNYVLCVSLSILRTITAIGCSVVRYRIARDKLTNLEFIFSLIVNNYYYYIITIQTNTLNCVLWNIQSRKTHWQLYRIDSSTFNNIITAEVIMNAAKISVPRNTGKYYWAPVYIKKWILGKLLVYVVLPALLFQNTSCQTFCGVIVIFKVLQEWLEPFWMDFCQLFNKAVLIESENFDIFRFCYFHFFGDLLFLLKVLR